MIIIFIENDLFIREDSELIKKKSLENTIVISGQQLPTDNTNQNGQYIQLLRTYSLSEHLFHYT